MSLTTSAITWYSARNTATTCCGTGLRKFPSLWTRSYFVETVGHISEKTVVHYIEIQKSKALSSPGYTQGEFLGKNFNLNFLF